MRGAYFEDYADLLPEIREAVPGTGLDSLALPDREPSAGGPMLQPALAGHDLKGLILDRVSVKGTLKAGIEMQNLGAVLFVVDEDDFLAPELGYGFFHATMYPSYTGGIPNASNSFLVKTGFPRFSVWLSSEAIKHPEGSQCQMEANSATWFIQQSISSPGLIPHSIESRYNSEIGKGKNPRRKVTESEQTTCTL